MLAWGYSCFLLNNFSKLHQNLLSAPSQNETVHFVVELELFTYNDWPVSLHSTPLCSPTDRHTVTHMGLWLKGKINQCVRNSAGYKGGAAGWYLVCHSQQIDVSMLSTAGGFWDLVGRCGPECWVWLEVSSTWQSRSWPCYVTFPWQLSCFVDLELLSSVHFLLHIDHLEWPTLAACSVR